MALNNLASRLSEVGLFPEAVTLAREAVDLYRSLADKAPDAFEADLAMALHNLASHLRDVDEPHNALASALDAATHYRALADRVPDVYEPDVASALHTLAGLLTQVGEPEAALAPAQEASNRYRQLADKATRAAITNAAGAKALAVAAMTGSLLARRLPAGENARPVKRRCDTSEGNGLTCVPPSPNQRASPHCGRARERRWRPCRKARVPGGKAPVPVCCGLSSPRGHSSRVRSPPRSS
jgi:tetratricopeptide (TPR) repeat protein